MDEGEPAYTSEWSHLTAPLFAVVAIVLLHFGSALAKDALRSVDMMSLLLLRLMVGGLLLLPLVWSSLLTLDARQWRIGLMLGCSHALFNGSMYWALQNLPLGLVATIGFLGPLAVSLLGISRPRELAWPLLGFAGVLLLAPFGESGASVTLPSIGAGLVYAAAWAIYILASSHAGRRLPGLSAFVIGTFVAAALVSPLGLAGVDTLATGGLAWTLAAIAVLSTLPFALEFEAMKRMPPKAFGVLLSLEPAIAATIGFILLGEMLDRRDLIAVALVSMAAAGVVTYKPESSPK